MSTGPLSAADLQKRLEGAPDPFPSLGADRPLASPQAKSSEKFNTDSEALFPSLGPASQNGNKAPPVAWTPAARAKPVLAPVYSESFVLNQVEAVRRTKEGRPLSVSDIIKGVQTKFKVKVEISSQLKSNQTSFSVKGDSQASVDAAKKALISDLSPVVKIKVEAPVSVVGAIVGAKGATLKAIRDQTHVKIDIPRRDTGSTLAIPSTNGYGSSHVSSRSASPLPSPQAEDEENEPTVTITIEGAAPMAQEAQLVIQQIIAEKTSRTSQKVKDIPAQVYPFALLRRADFLRASEGREVNLNKDDMERSITISGDREAVGKVVETIKSCIAFYEGDLSMVKISLPKIQHYLLIDGGADEILNKAKCVVIVPDITNSSEDVLVWGKPKDLGPGLQAVMERAASAHTASVPISGADPSQVLMYLHRSGYVARLAQSHPSVLVHLPFPPVTPASPITIDFSGTKTEVDVAQKGLAEFLKGLAGSTKVTEIDPLVHKILLAKAGKQIKGYHSSKNVLVYFPSANDHSSKVLLVYDPLGGGVKAVSEKKKLLSEVESEILAVVKTLGEIRVETLTIEKKWHDAIKGKNNSTLNAIIGEGKALAVQIGPNDTVTVRGSPADVEGAVKEISEVVEEAKTDEIESGYSLEFIISREFVARIVGSGGAGIQKYRDQLDVKVDIEDSKETEQVVGKKKSAPSAQSVIKVTGRQRNAEETKKRILAQVEKLADETIEVLRIPRQYHSSIIGAQGKYIQRLQDKYGVRINMPKEDAAKTDEVTIKGGKKGVSQARQEINELVEFEKENNNIVSFTVPSRAVSRILGQKGSKVNEIAADSGAHIDVTKDDSDTATITLRGTKKACAAAKATVVAIANSVEDEALVTIKIEPKFHRTIIGGGGVGLKNLLARVGGPTEPREQARLVRFPQPPNDEVVIRGEKNLVKKVAAELERVVANLRERVVLGVVIPNQHHKSLIGHGGQPLTELEKKTGAEVQFPGSRSYHQVATPSNLEEFGDAGEKDIVKVAGSKSACDKAIAELLAAVAANPVRTERKESERGPRQQATNKVQVPFKHFHVLSHNGNLMRDLRAVGVYATVFGKPVPAGTNGAAPATRIDDEPTNGVQESHGVEWRVIEYGSDVEPGDADVLLKARDTESLAIAENLVKEAISKANKSTTTAYMTFPDRNVFPRIIGSKGSVISELCSKTDADINVPKDDFTITIHGTNEAVNSAKAEITGVAFGRRAGPGGVGRRHSDRR